MQVKTITVGPFETNCFLAWTNPAEAFVIDPGADADVIAETIMAHRLTVAAILLTHGHVDHVSAVADVQDRFEAPVFLHPSDLPWAFSPSNQMPPYFPPPRAPSDLRPIPANGVFDAIPDVIQPRVLHTPGHTPGCVCFHWPNAAVLFSGDTLFAGSVGRTDLPGGDARTLAQSLKQIAVLDAETSVYPGHGPRTSIAREKKENYFLRQA
jgi:glyoxylase-like metal-dependent hydrolase (beta-lactamase superfamily II)